MIFSQTSLYGVYVIDVERIEDERGFFARTWCKKEFDHHELTTALVQCNVSFNKRKGTLRGMHYQKSPYGEEKIIRCTSGVIYDVIVDLRTDSETYTQWTAVEMSSNNLRMLYVPKGCAHGFLTLTDNTEVFYQMSEIYHQESATGVRWNDPAFSIDWPEKVQVISDRDRNYPDFAPELPK